MITREVEVADLFNKYDNPIAELVHTAFNYECSVYATSNNRKANLKSIMGIMALDWSKGQKVTVVTEGDKEEEAAEAVVTFLRCEA